MIIIPLIASGITAIVTAGITYFAAKPATQNNEKTQFESAGSIKNNVTIEEKMDVLAIFTVCLLLILLLIKFVEFAIVTISSYKRSMKKKYQKTPQLTTVAVQAPLNQANQAQEI